jgi:hypothetical protein
MRRVIWGIAGFWLGFAIITSIVAAAALAVIGVGGHLLARYDNGSAQIISFDPSTVASRAPFPAAMALFLAVLFGLIYHRLKRAERRNLKLGRG